MVSRPLRGIGLIFESRHRRVASAWRIGQNYPSKARLLPRIFYFRGVANLVAVPSVLWRSACVRVGVYRMPIGNSPARV
jgi:hypothetical protein